MPFNFGQLFVKNPYENEIDPETGIQKRPSMWQSIAWNPEADQVLKNNYQQKQFANTNQPLSSNPAYGAAGPGDVDYNYSGDPSAAIKQYGTNNPYLRPSAATAFWHPETQKIWQQFQDAPAEQQLQRQAYEGMTPSVINREALNREAVWGETQEQQGTRELWRQQAAFADIPINAEQAAATHKAITTEKSKQAASEIIALQRTPIWESMPDWLKRMSPEDAGKAIGDDPRLSNILAQSMAAAGLKSNLPDITAAQQKAETEKRKLEAEEELKTIGGEYAAKRAQHEFTSRQFAKANELGAPEALANRQHAEDVFGVPLGSLSSTPMLTRLGPQGFTSVPNTQYVSPKTLEREESLRSIQDLTNVAKKGEVNRIGGKPAIRPAMGFSADNLSTNASLPTSLQQPSAPAMPLNTQPTGAVRPPYGANFVMKETAKNTALAPFRSLKEQGKWIYDKAIKPTVEELDAAREVLRKIISGGTE